MWEIVGEVLLRILILLDMNIVVVVFDGAILLERVLEMVEDRLVAFHVHLYLFVDVDLLLHFLSYDLVDLSIFVVQKIQQWLDIISRGQLVQTFLQLEQKLFYSLVDASPVLIEFELLTLASVL